jgi:hypothetical protein
MINEILLSNADGNFPNVFHRFVLNPLEFSITDNFAKDKDTYQIGVSGSGQFVNLFGWPSKRIFACMYVLDRRLIFWSDGTSHEVVPSLRARHEWCGPCVRRFRLFFEDRLLATYVYFHFNPLTFPDLDML